MMIIILEFSNGKSRPGRHEKCKLRSTEKCERSHMKRKKTVIQYKRNQSQNVVPHKILPEINLLRKIPGCKIHSLQPGCYDHVTGKI